jgi:hypothetical protein
MWIGARCGLAPDVHPISNAPFDRELELAVIDEDGRHLLVFPCRRTLGGWANAETKQSIDVWPTHWREWTTTT